jgi:hypothetical protein
VALVGHDRLAAENDLFGHEPARHAIVDHSAHLELCSRREGDHRREFECRSRFRLIVVADADPFESPGALARHASGRDRQRALHLPQELPCAVPKPHVPVCGPVAGAHDEQVTVLPASHALERPPREHVRLDHDPGVRSE